MQTLSHDRPEAYYQDGKLYLRASAYGGCVRGLALQAAGYQGSTSILMQQKAQGGLDLEEAAIQGLIQKYPAYTVSRQQEEVLWDMGEVVLGGHIDGAVFNPQTYTHSLLEVKSMSPQALSDFLGAPNPWELRPKYGWQVSFYGHALGVQSVLMCLVENLGMGEMGEVKTRLLNLPWERVAIENRCQEIAKAANKAIRVVAGLACAREEPEESIVPIYCTEAPSRWCRFSTPNLDAGCLPKPEAQQPRANHEALLPLLQRDRELAKREQELLEERDVVRARIGELVGDARHLEVGPYRITKSTGTWFDTRGFAKSYPELYNLFRTGERTTMRISRKGEEDGDE